MTARPLAIDARDVHVSFGRRPVLAGLDLQVAAGEIVALVGRSGCGKSTLVRVVGGLLAPTAAGRLECGASTIVFQEPRLLPWEPVWANVSLGLGERPARARELAATSLAEVGLAGREDDLPGTLSGGEQQRVALARALIRGARLLLLDEPFGALDALTRREMHALLLRLAQVHDQSVLLVTHDVDEAVTLADRVVVLAQGRLGVDHPGDRAATASPAERDMRRRAVLAALGA